MLICASDIILGADLRCFAMKDMISVNLDIAGFFFRIAVQVPANATVKDVMDAAVAATAGGPTATTPKLTYSSEDYSADPNGKTINTLTVIHADGSAKSGQTNQDMTSTGRVYGDGIYYFTDDAVLLPKEGDTVRRLRPADPNKSSVQAWQYYVYDKDGVDQARKPEARSRRIVPFDSTAGGYTLTENSTVVWRLVGIFLRPTHAEEAQLPTKVIKCAEIMTFS
jgi:hypothetical protein